MAHIHLAAVVRRTVRYEQDFSTGFRERFADAEIVPDLFANRNADSHAPEIIRSRDLALIEDALFIELAIIRQIDLVTQSDHLAAIEQGDGIMPALLALARQTDHDTRPAIRRFGRQRLQRLPAGA